MLVLEAELTREPQLSILVLEAEVMNDSTGESILALEEEMAMATVQEMIR